MNGSSDTVGRFPVCCHYVYLFWKMKLCVAKKFPHTFTLQLLRHLMNANIRLLFCEIYSTSIICSCSVAIKSVWPSKDWLDLQGSFILIYCWLNLLSLVFAHSVPVRAVGQLHLLCTIVISVVLSNYAKWLSWCIDNTVKKKKKIK